MTPGLNLRELKSQMLIILFGIVSGISSQLNVLADYSASELSNFALVSRIALGAAAFPILLLGLRKIIRRLVLRSSLPISVRERYSRYDSLTYAVFLLTMLGAVGVQFTLPAVAVVVLIFLFLQVFLVYFLMDRHYKREILSSLGWLSFLFLISGFAALIYQIVWQRALFTAFGVNIESVTIIVSIFMFGLGIGSLAGGFVSKKYPTRLPELFMTCEILIGLFGIVSLPLIKAVSSVPVHNSLLKISLATSALLCFPTMLMGATLPILVTYLYMHYKNVGRSVGKLYFINTVGSAIACFVTADMLFALSGKQTTVVVASLCNFSVVFLVYKYLQNKRDRVEVGRQNEDVRYFPEGQTNGGRLTIRFFLILALSAMTGYISLSQEILWFRAISYTTGGRPDVFAHILGFFLFGIAFGALAAKKICEREKDYTLTFVAVMLSISSVFYYFSMPLTGQLLTVSKALGMNELYLSVGVISFLTGGIFPALCHFGIKSPASVGFSLSWVYFANILGSTAGPLFTGFVLLNSYTLEQNILYLSLITIALAGVMWIYFPFSAVSKVLITGGVVLGFAGMFFIHNGIYSQLFEKLHYKTGFQQKKPYKYLIQNRSGVIAVEPSITDIVYGGGIYDGRFNTDPVLNTNLITRAYMIAALHPKPEEVLLIGLSSGSWARVIANHTGVKKFTIVEINPGYIELIQRYPEIAALLRDPKVSIHIDDGRRWLSRHPAAKFDIITMNTTFHWRDGITNLLSDEFLRLCKSHLKKRGILYYNMTFSEDVPFTAAKVFRYVSIYKNMVIASDSPVVMSREERRDNLLKFENSGKPVFAEDRSASQRVLQELASSDISDRAEAIRSKKGLWHITDDNMATEFKLRNRWYNPETTWAKLFKRS